MRALGFPVKKEEVKKIVADYDKSGASRVSYDDFVELSAYLVVVAGGTFVVPLLLVLTHPPVVAGDRDIVSLLARLTHPPSSPSPFLPLPPPPCSDGAVPLPRP
jgi:hypothetical protein